MKRREFLIGASAATIASAAGVPIADAFVPLELPIDPMGRFKLIDEEIGTFEYVGEEPFVGILAWDINCKPIEGYEARIGPNGQIQTRRNKGASDITIGHATIYTS